MSLTTFVGRERELSDLRLLLREGKRLVTLTGIGGIGKTRLALELGFSATEFGLANVYFVELASLTNPGLIDSSSSNQWAAIRAALRCRRRSSTCGTLGPCSCSTAASTSSRRSGA